MQALAMANLNLRTRLCPQTGRLFLRTLAYIVNSLSSFGAAQRLGAVAYGNGWHEIRSIVGEHYSCSGLIYDVAVMDSPITLRIEPGAFDFDGQQTLIKRFPNANAWWQSNMAKSNCSSSSNGYILNGDSVH